MRIKHILTTVTVMTGMAMSAETPVYLDPNAPVEARVEDALSRMTLEEKVGLCHAQSKFTSKGVERLGIPEVRMLSLIHI